MAQTYTADRVREALTALQLNGGNIKRTARELGIPHPTLISWRTAALTKSPEMTSALTHVDPVPRDYVTLWGDASNIVLEAAVVVAGRCREDLEPERQSMNLKALTGLAHVAAQHHLNHRDGRPNAGAVNIDARQQTIYSADSLIAAIIKARAQPVIEGTVTDEP